MNLERDISKNLRFFKICCNLMSLNFVRLSLHLFWSNGLLSNSLG